MYKDFISVSFLLITIAVLISLVFSELELSVKSTLLPCVKKEKMDLSPPYHIIEDCHRKIRLVINILNSGKSAEGFQYIYVKEVSDPVTDIKMPLLNPIVVQLRQDQVLLAYPFKYLSAVNGKVSEVIVNYENKKNYSGCDDTSSINPTCGIKYDKGIAVPFSEGFCCFCPQKAVKEKQTRGGQDCSLQVDPQDIEKQKYKASAHCLHFSDVWFSVSALDDPVIIHNIYAQVFNQRHLTNGSSLWFSLTHGEEYQLGPKTPSHYDENKTIVATFLTANPKNGTFVISAENNRLLIPQQMPGVGVDKLPPVLKNGASDYLLLSKSIIQPKGDECDKAGISYEGFVKQKDRCKVAKHTCLKNQPLDFWEGDEEKRKSGRKGSYMLHNYGKPYKDPILVDQETKEHWLALENHEKQLSVLTIEFNADYIVALTVGKEVQIATVITACYEKKLVFHVSIANTGLVEASLSATVSKCEYKVPDSDTVTHVVYPQLREDYVLTSVPGEIELSEKFHCTIVVTSKQYGIVAKRKVTMKPLHRCICNWHCRCACLGESMVCKPMEEEEYHEAGFKGSLPVLTAKPPYRPWIIAHPFLFLLAILLILLILGAIKASLRVMKFLKIGDYGFKSRIYRSGYLKQYTEHEIRLFEVEYDDDGYPVHPDMKYRTKAISDEMICLLNVLFFFIWPFMKCFDCCFKRKKKGERYETLKTYSNDSEDEKPTLNKDLQQKNERKQLEPNEKTIAHSNSPLGPKVIDETPHANTRPLFNLRKREPFSSESKRTRNEKESPKIPKQGRGLNSPKENKLRHLAPGISKKQAVKDEEAETRSKAMKRSRSDSRLLPAPSDPSALPPTVPAQQWRKGAIRAAAFGGN